MFSDATSIAGFLSGLEPGEDVFDYISRYITDALHPMPTKALKIDVAFMMVVHTIIMLLSLVGIYARYKNGQAWFFRVEQGLVRPNAAVVVQHVVAWVTAVAPTTSVAIVSTSSFPRLSRSIAIRRFQSFFAIFTLVIFVLSFALPAYYIAIGRNRVFRAEVALFDKVAAIKASGQGEIGLLSAVPEFEELQSAGDQLLYYFRIVVGLYFAWGVCWMVVYVPTATRLVSLLRQRRRRFRRAIKSLRVLDDIVSEEASAKPPVIPFPSVPFASPPPRITTTTPSARNSLNRSHRVSRPTSYFDPYGAGSPLESPPPPFPSSPPLSPREFASSSSSPKAPSYHSPTLPQFPPPARTPAIEVEAPGAAPPLPALEPPPPRRKKPSSRPSTGDSLEVPPRTRRKKPSSRPGTGDSTSSTGRKVAQARDYAEKLMEEVGLTDGRLFLRRGGSGKGDEEAPRPLKPATMVRIEEAMDQLVKTNRLLLTLGLQLVVTLTMCASYFSFCIYILSGRGNSALHSVYISWIGWTFAGPALVTSSVFAIFSLRSPPPSPSNALTPSQSSPTAPDDEDFVPPPFNRESAESEPEVVAKRPHPSTILESYKALARKLEGVGFSRGQPIDTTSRHVSPCSRGSVDMPGGPNAGKTRIVLPLRTRLDSQMSEATTMASGSGSGSGAMTPGGGRKEKQREQWVPSAWVREKVRDEEKAEEEIEMS
ncbi:hypothetical protein MNV49_003512 [Pseudohyphozyma bogoriensis]|nr:hypothetical protein MNV49_003512 [Pseudohyphozyma bogoriensis]